MTVVEAPGGRVKLFEIKLKLPVELDVIFVNVLPLMPVLSGPAVAEPAREIPVIDPVAAAIV